MSVPSPLLVVERTALIDSMQWTTKLYEFERGQPPLPPLIYSCCRTLARSMPWQHAYPDLRHACDDPAASPPRPDWQRWKEAYEPDAGIVNFVCSRPSSDSAHSAARCITGSLTGALHR